MEKCPYCKKELKDLNEDYLCCQNDNCHYVMEIERL